MSSSKVNPDHVREFALPGLTPLADAALRDTILVFEPLEFGAGGRPGLTQAELMQKGRQILEEAKNKAQEIERQAYEQGFLQGQKDGQEVGEKSLAEVTQRFLDLITALEQDKEVLYRRREEDLLRLVLVVAEKLVARELATNPESIRDIIARGFQYLADHENLRLVLHPQDHQLLQQVDFTGWPAGVTLVPDGFITPGGFRLETASGDLDGTREHLWVRVAQVVQEALEKLDDNWAFD